MSHAFPVDGAGWPTRPALRFGYRRSRTHVHQGVDIMAPEGRAIRAMAAGTVVVAIETYTRGWRGYGRCVLIHHDGASTYELHAHTSRLDVRRGDHVEAGQIVGAVGRTKWATPRMELFGQSGAHDHIEVRTHHPVRREPPGGGIVDRIDPVAWHAQGGAPGPFSTPATSKRTRRPTKKRRTG